MSHDKTNYILLVLLKYIFISVKKKRYIKYWSAFIIIIVHKYWRELEMQFILG